MNFMKINFNNTGSKNYKPKNFAQKSSQFYKISKPYMKINQTKVKDIKKMGIHFSICACHPCAGAMLIFSVSFQF